MTKLVRWLLDLLTDLLICLERRALRGYRQPVDAELDAHYTSAPGTRQIDPHRVKARRSRTRVRHSSYDL